MEIGRRQEETKGKARKGKKAKEMKGRKGKGRKEVTDQALAD